MEDSFEQNEKAVARLRELSEALTSHMAVEPPAIPDVDANLLIRECIVMLQATLNLHEVETDLTEIPGICCYRSRVGQSITAILLNAAEVLQQKHKRSLSHGENFVGKIRVETRSEERDGTHGVLIAVADNADVIEEVVRLFLKIFTTKPEGRSRLGLSIARRLLSNTTGRSMHPMMASCGARLRFVTAWWASRQTFQIECSTDSQ